MEDFLLWSKIDEFIVHTFPSILLIHDGVKLEGKEYFQIFSTNENIKRKTKKNWFNKSLAINAHWIGDNKTKH